MSWPKDVRGYLLWCGFWSTIFPFGIRASSTRCGGQHSGIQVGASFRCGVSVITTKLRIDLGLQVLEIVIDSRLVIIKCQSAEQDWSMIEAIIRDIQSTKNHFQDLRFRFIPKTGNYFAHFIANEALKRGEGQYLEGDIPSSVRIAMEKEHLRIAKWKACSVYV